MLSTRGAEPADGFTAVLFAHHDPKTMAWSSTPLIAVPPPADVPVDVPPWWRMKKKTSMFYVGGGRGDHARIMMTASILCTSSVEESRAIDAYFADIRSVDREPRRRRRIRSRSTARSPIAGSGVFDATCSRCHGTYGDGGTYPNRLISTEEIGTDPVLASGPAQFAAPFVDWFKDSFFGEIARLEPQQGYVAPPLDGIWATAPYPAQRLGADDRGAPRQLAAPHVLDALVRLDRTTIRPRSGWHFTRLDHGKDGETDPSEERALRHDAASATATPATPSATR